jgi:hypothetical protein
MAGAFLEAIEMASTPSELDEAFPLDVLAATSEIDVFYDHFGVDR